jgi:hypothetical protein
MGPGSRIRMRNAYENFPKYIFYFKYDLLLVPAAVLQDSGMGRLLVAHASNLCIQPQIVIDLHEDI